METFPPMSRAIISQVRFRKADAKLKIVYGEVYVPNRIDAQDDMMTDEAVRKMAHNFLRHRMLSETIDTDHDNFPAGAYPVESFIVRKGDPDFPEEGAWVIGVQITDDKLWRRIEKGELAGFSLEGRARKAKAEVVTTIKALQYGETAPDEDDGHTHYWTVRVDPKTGKILKGFTSPAEDGHVHTITRGTATDMTLGHKHRFFIHQ